MLPVSLGLGPALFHPDSVRTHTPCLDCPSVSAEAFGVRLGFGIHLRSPGDARGRTCGGIWVLNARVAAHKPSDWFALRWTWALGLYGFQSDGCYYSYAALETQAAIDVIFCQLLCYVAAL